MGQSWCIKILGFGCPVNVCLRSKHEDKVLYLGKHESSDSSKNLFFCQKPVFFEGHQLVFFSAPAVSTLSVFFGTYNWGL
jgi:hypothetical protein